MQRKAQRLPKGIYDREYHMEAQNCVNRRHTSKRSLANPGSGKKMHPTVATKHDKYVMEVNFRFSSNMFSNCRLGPHKNVMDNNERVFPRE